MNEKPEKREEVEEESWAMSLLSDYKKSSKRWFIAFMCMLFLNFAIIGSIVGAVVYVFSNYEIGTVDFSQDGEGVNYGIVGSEGVTFGSDYQSDMVPSEE